MNRSLTYTFFLCLLMAWVTVYGQKGIGENKGLAQTNDFPELVQIEGIVKEIKTGPCPLTSGKSKSGTHVMVVSGDSVLNVHLGPTNRVENFIAKSEDLELKATVFRTEKLPKDHYIAQKIALGDKELVLRDGYLKPFWANRNCRAIWR